MNDYRRVAPFFFHFFVQKLGVLETMQKQRPWLNVLALKMANIFTNYLNKKTKV